MQNVLMLYPEMLFYKIPIFNKLSKKLEEKGITLLIWAQDYQEKADKATFKSIRDTPMTMSNYRRVLKDNKIDKVINILFKSNPGYLFYFYSVLYPKLKGKEVIFYGHGVNKQQIGPISVFIYNLVHLLFDRIILYSPTEKKYLWRIFHQKISVAYNTLDLEGRREGITQTKNEIQKQYQIKHDFIVLFSGRIQGRKKLDTLINVFEKHFNKNPEVGLAIIGPDMNPEILNRINELSNIYYLGPIYDTNQLSKIFFISDVFCIPGALGLAIVEAIYWGLPIITTNINHGPEAFYLNNGVNSFVVDSEVEIAERIKELKNDNSKLLSMKKAAIETYEQNATLDRMFSGFYDALI